MNGSDQILDLTLAWLRDETPCFFLYLLWTLTHSSINALMDCGFLDRSWDDPELELDESLFLSLLLKICEQQQPMIRSLVTLSFKTLSCCFSKTTQFWVWALNRYETSCTVSECNLVRKKKKNWGLSLKCKAKHGVVNKNKLSV